MNRREFPKAVRVEIIKRADGKCEFCGALIDRFEVDHKIADAMTLDKQGRLAAKDGWLLCIPCHKSKTASADAPALARAKRRESRHLGERAPAVGVSEIARRFR